MGTNLRLFTPISNKLLRFVEGGRDLGFVRLRAEEIDHNASFMTTLPVLRNRPSIRCTAFFVLIVRSKMIMPEYIRIPDALIQEACVGLGGLFNLMSIC